MIRRARLSIITLKYLWRVGLLWFLCTLQLDCLLYQVTLGCSTSVHKGSSGLGSVVWSPRTRAPRRRCQQMALGNTESRPRVAEDGEKSTSMCRSWKEMETLLSIQFLLKSNMQKCANRAREAPASSSWTPVSQERENCESLWIFKCKPILFHFIFHVGKLEAKKSKSQNSN